MDPSGTLSTSRQEIRGTALSAWLQAVSRSTTILLKAHRFPLMVIGLYLAAACALSLIGLRAPPAEMLTAVIRVFFAAIILPILISRLSPGKALRLANVLLTASLMLAIEVAALGFKTNIPALNPFSWDAKLASLDRFLHAGTDPWRLLMPASGQIFVLKGLDLAYGLWFPLLLASWLLIGAGGRHDHLKNRYLLAFFLTWVLGGNLFATVFSSAGPAFLNKLGLPVETHQQLLEHLTRAHAQLGLTAVDLQGILWEQHETGTNLLGGISAFPSMHNALAALMALAAWQAHRGLGILMTVFAALIYAGSILLAWHYAVDGIAGVAIAFLCWHIAGRIARHLDQRPETRRYRALLRATADR